MEKIINEEKKVIDELNIEANCAEKDDEKIRDTNDEDKSKEKKSKYMSEADAYYLMFGIEDENLIEKIRESLYKAKPEDFEYLAFQISHLAHTKEHDEFETEITLLFYVGISYLCTSIRKQDRTLESLYKMFDTVDVSETSLKWKHTLDIMIKESSKNNETLLFYKQLRESSGEHFNKICVAAKSILFPYVKNNMDKVKFYGPLNIEDREEKTTKEKRSAERRLSQELERAVNIKPIADPTYIKAYLDKSVVGQEEAKRSLSIALANHMCAYYNHTDAPGGTTLIIGPTGSGKTFLAEKLSEYSNLPIAIIDSTQLTGDGWRGLDKSEVFKNLYENNDPEKAKYGIVVLDEFDKLLDKSQLYDTFGHDAISTALGILDGTPVMDTNRKSGESAAVYQTKNILFILTGSFEKMNTTEGNPIGFDESGSTEENKDIRKRLIEYGVMPEIVGRLSGIVSTRLMTEEEILTAILDKEDSYINQYQNLVKNFGKEILLEREYVADLVHFSMKNKLGVRGAKNALSDKIREALYKSFEDKSPVVKLCCN